MELLAKLIITFFEHKDWLNTDRIHTDLNGATAATLISQPYGDGDAETFSEDYADWDFYHFADMGIHLESGLHEAQFRQYSSAQGRWMSPDPYDGSYDFSNPQSFNRYSYVLNNPLSFVDPMGLSDCPEGKTCGPPDCPYDTCVVVTGNPPPGDPDPTGPGENPPGTTGGGGGGSAPNKPTVIPNPCPYQGRALPPSAYAMAGKQANDSPVNFTLDVTMGFPAGHYLDPQPLGSGNVYQNQAYGNYTFGVYMASAGVSLSTALSGANAYAFFRASYPSWTQMDPNYSRFQQPMWRTSPTAITHR